MRQVVNCCYTWKIISNICYLYNQQYFCLDPLQPKRVTIHSPVDIHVFEASSEDEITNGRLRTRTKQNYKEPALNK